MSEKHIELIGNPTPIGLIGLAIGCFTLGPIEFGWTKGSDPQVWIWMFMTAGMLQLFAGIIDLLNKNILGATAFTLYGVLWICNAWVISTKLPADPTIKAFIYVTYLLLSLFLLLGFMTVSFNLTLVLVEFNLIFILNIIAGFYHDFHHTGAIIIGVLLFAVAIQVMWAAAGGVINNLLGKNLFPQGKAPLQKKPVFEKHDDFASIRQHEKIRERIVSVLYEFWEMKGWEFTNTTHVVNTLNAKPDELAPDFWYLWQKGYVALDEDKYKQDPNAPKWVRLTPSGIDYYGELSMRNFKF